MADVTATNIEETIQSSPEGADQTSVPLRFPTIDLQTSFESLLSHSSTSSAQTATMGRSTNVPPSLDESWASLDASDFFQDEELQSNNADTESLIDLGSNQDTESANNDDTLSQTQPEDEEAENIVAVEPAEVQQQDRTGQEPSEEDEPMDDTIVLRKSNVQPNDDSVELEYNFVSANSILQAKETRQSVQETIRMTVAKSPLNLAGHPFKVAYYGAASTRGTKDELLGKIGAALVSPIPRSPRKAKSSSVYSVVPTEFGPGSRPAFADLIPSHAQMAVDDISVKNSMPEQPGNIQLELEEGLTLESRPRRLLRQPSSPPWRPDLLIVQISRDDIADRLFAVSDILEVARRHRWPTVVVTTDTVPSQFSLLVDHGITKSYTIATVDGTLERSEAVDLDTFLSLDTDQLNHYLQFLTEKCQETSKVKPLFERVCDLARDIYHTVQPLTAVTGEIPGSDGKYDLVVVQPEHNLEQTDSDVFKNKDWSSMKIRDMVKDVLLSCTIMLLGIYIAIFSHNLVSEAVTSVEANTTMAAAQNPSTSTRLAATPSALISPAVDVARIEQDVVVYGPVLFDQVWERLTGRTSAEQHKSTVSEPVSKIPQSPVSIDIADTARETRSYGKKWKDVVGAMYGSSHTTDQPQAAEEGFKATVKKQKSPAQGGNLHKVGTVKETPSHASSAIHEPNQMVTNFSRADSRKRPFAFIKQGFAETLLFEKIARRHKLKMDMQDQIQNIHQQVSGFSADVSKKMHGIGQQTQDQFNDIVKQSQTQFRRAKWAGERRLETILDKQKNLLAKAQQQAHVLTHEVPKRKKSFFPGR
ncbi:hypothetical protein LTR05_006084 [Lithohypha guttulata]|uniref:Uncharacterized protein n=1 Tax=Lithohypha guttulata TaxID=1690604 RepID=A0AAN7Y517_9EURO|nr:hypothetical protein LTR05_006084 [Lithohypha guttulata]